MKESQRIEWKETWRDEFLKWICGFANAEGGVLHIGRNDRGVVVGVPNAARLLEEIPNKVRDILGIIVAWGRGIERIMETSRAARAPTPRIRYEPSGLWVEFKLPPGEVAGLGEKLGEGDKPMRSLIPEPEGLARRREKTRALKQAMMQELLTGRTRLVARGDAEHAEVKP